MLEPSSTAASLVAAGMLAVPSPAVAADSADTAWLVTKVRTEAAWRGVNVERIRRDDQQLAVVGQDRRGRDVTFTMNCGELGYVCQANRAGGGFRAIAR